MEFFFAGDLQKRPQLLTVMIAVSTAGILLLNGYGLIIGVTTVLPHLFYIPIILTAYYFPRRGVPFAVVVSALYFGLTYEFLPVINGELISAAGRVVIFILIAGVVSLLTNRLQESSSLFRGVAERSSDIIILTDSTGKATYVSPSSKNILGYSPDEIIGNLPGAFIHPDDLGLLEAAVPDGSSRRLPEGMTVRFRKKNGDYALIEFFGTPVIKDGRVSGIQIIGRDVTERRHVEDVLKESEEKYRTLADYTYDWEYWIAPDGSIVYTTPSCERITGYTPGDFYTDKQLLRTIIFPTDREALEHHLSHFFTSEKAGSVDFRIVCRDGRIRWIGHVCQPLYNAKGDAVGRRASNRDITERKLVEEAFRDTSRRLAEIIDFLPDPTMVIDSAGIVVAWNHAMELMSGMMAPDVLGKGVAAYTAWIADKKHTMLINYVLRRDVEGIHAAYPNVHFEGDTVRTDTVVTRRDGIKLSLWISATPLISQDGIVTGAIESLRDVTPQKRTEYALRESNAYLDAVMNTLADPLFVKDRNHCFVKVNSAFCQFTGHTRDELLGRSDNDFFKKEEAEIFWEKDEVVFRTRQENENEENITDSTGNTHTIITKKTLYTNAAGEEFIVGIIRDITERKKTEQVLHLALKKLNMLSSITRHDILNQIMALRVFLELAKELEKNPELFGFLEKGDLAAGAIQRQIEFTRYYEDLGVQAPRWHDVAETFLSAASQLPLGEISVDVQVPALQVYADPLIEKVFYNLVENSQRHGGHVTSLVLRAEETGDGVIITYCDNGTGITDEDRKKLFQRGFGKHTGLGLFLSREILSITGITIRENGIAGQGVRFEIQVPKGAFRFP